jgi:DNA-binding Xre family transcriptional regulator
MNILKKTAKQRKPLDAQLCEMVRQSGMTLNAVAVAAGVPQPVLYRFYNGEQESITLQNAEKICAYFDVRLTAPKRRKQAEKGKK